MPRANMSIAAFAALAVVSLVAAACAMPAARSAPGTASATRATAPFGTMPDGTPVDQVTLRNAHGIEMHVISYGGIITALRTPDREGRLDDIVLGYDSLAGYLRSSPYFGAIVGRYANRIARGRFTLDGRSYQLTINDGQNHLHGGTRGLDKVVWKMEPFDRAARDARTSGGAGVVLTYTSPDGDQGYPGALSLRVTYTLTDRDELVVDYEATTSAPTALNISQHSYFNLAGSARRDILDHRLVLDADGFTPVDSTLIPTGEIRAVAGTPFDFRTPHAIGERIGAADEQLRFGRGYDHNWVLRRDGVAAGTLAHAVTLHEPASGRTLDIFTDQPGVQFYSGNFLDGTITGKGGHVYQHRYGLCLETQHFPDSPNHPSFPSTTLRPGETFRSRTVYAFGVRR